MDPNALAQSDPRQMNFGGDTKKAWKDIWGCGQGIGPISRVQAVAQYVAKLKREYTEVKARLVDI